MHNVWLCQLLLLTELEIRLTNIHNWASEVREYLYACRNGHACVHTADVNHNTNVPFSVGKGRTLFPLKPSLCLYSDCVVQRGEVRPIFNLQASNLVCICSYPTYSKVAIDCIWNSSKMNLPNSSCLYITHHSGSGMLILQGTNILHTSKYICRTLPLLTMGKFVSEFSPLN